MKRPFGARIWRALRRRSFAVLALPLLFLPVSYACALEVSDGHVRGLPPGQTTTAAFFVLHNEGTEDWVLTEAGSPVAERVEIHRHQNRDGAMSMRRVEQVSIPAGGRFEFAPGGYHLMLMGLQRSLREGETVALTLREQGGEAVTVELPVVSVLNEQRRRK